MSALYENMMEDCVMMNKTQIPDGMGGWKNNWKEGIRFKAAFQKNTTLEAKIAQQNGFTELYTITAYREYNIEFNDVIKRLSDGQIFKVTSKMTDNKSPAFSGINFGQVSAETTVLV